LIEEDDAISNKDLYERDALDNPIQHTDRNGSKWNTSMIELRD